MEGGLRTGFVGLMGTLALELAEALEASDERGGEDAAAAAAASFFW